MYVNAHGHFSLLGTTLVLARLPRALPICARQGAASLLLEKTSLYATLRLHPNYAKILTVSKG